MFRRISTVPPLEVGIITILFITDDETELREVNDFSQDHRASKSESDSSIYLNKWGFSLILGKTDLGPIQGLFVTEELQEANVTHFPLKGVPSGLDSEDTFKKFRHGVKPLYYKGPELPV